MSNGNGPPNDLVDQVLDGRYRVVRLLAEGGMSAVYEAEQLNVDRQVAIKVLQPGINQDPNMLARFRAEARIISQLTHPNTLKLFDYGHTEDGLLYLVTELLHGESLATRLARGPMAPRQALRILEQVLPSLNEAHERGIIHRDLKPGNLFLQDVAGETVVKVLDFGIAKMKAPPESDPEHPTTADGMLLGTPAYLSPEQANGRALDARSDIYSLGVVAYHCLSGQVPFPGEPVAQMLAHVSRPPPPFETLDSAPLVPPPLAEMVYRWMAKKPKQRPGSAATALEEVHRVHDQLFGSGRSAIPPSEAPTTPTKRGGGGLFIAALVIAGGATAAWFASRPAQVAPRPDAGLMADATTPEPADAGFTPDAAIESLDATAPDTAVIVAGVRVQRRAVSGAWRSEVKVYSILERVEPIAVDCYRRTQKGADLGRFVTLTFIVGAGVSVQVEPADTAGRTYRRCLSFRLPKLPWPARGDTSTASLVIGDSAYLQRPDE